MRRVALALLAVSAGFAGEKGMFYRVDAGKLVFTNTPTRAARPVPGMAVPVPVPPRASPARREAGMPVTIYDAHIARVAREHRLSAELVKAVAQVESNFDTHAVSAKGARGLMQLMPATAKQYGVRDPHDPLENLRAGAAHLRYLLDRFDGDVTLALAAYNAGEGTVRRHGGVPAYPETRAYVRRVRSRLAPAAPAPLSRAADVRRVVRSDGSILLSN